MQSLWWWLQTVHEDIHDEVVERLKKAYGQVRIGDPLEGKAKHQKLGFYRVTLDCKRLILKQRQKRTQKQLILYSRKFIILISKIKTI